MVSQEPQIAQSADRLHGQVRNLAAWHGLGELPPQLFLAHIKEGTVDRCLARIERRHGVSGDLVACLGRLIDAARLLEAAVLHVDGPGDLVVRPAGLGGAKVGTTVCAEPGCRLPLPGALRLDRLQLVSLAHALAECLFALPVVLDDRLALIELTGELDLDDRHLLKAAGQGRFPASVPRDDRAVTANDERLQYAVRADALHQLRVGLLVAVDRDAHGVRLEACRRPQAR